MMQQANISQFSNSVACPEMCESMINAYADKKK